MNARAITPAPRSKWLPAILSILIILWQFDTQYRTPIIPTYPMRASIGLYPELIAEVWPYYYYGVFPVCSIAEPPPSKPQADIFIRDHANQLAMDLNLPCSMIRHGDFGRLWLLLPSVYLTGDPVVPSVVRLDQTLFIAALLCILWSFWREQKFLLGILIILLVGSDPFQQDQLAQENIFSLPITFALFTLAANLPLITGRLAPKKSAFLIAAASAVFLATARDIRAEAAMAIAALPIIYLTIPDTPWLRRLALIATLTASYLLTSFAWTKFWNYKIEQATQWVAAHGGHPYDGYRTPHHTLWHVLWEGLGDFDHKFSYAWDDKRAFTYAAPILRSQYHLNITYTAGYHSDQTYPPDHYYWISPEDLPQYTDLMRAKVLHDITHHPLWYAGILDNRFWAILGQAVPARLALGPVVLETHYLTYFTPLAWPLLIWRRKWQDLKIILISLTLSLTPLFVYTGQGTTYWGIFHLVTLAVITNWAIAELLPNRHLGGLIPSCPPQSNSA
ncbi:MAG: hypothetical protein ABSF29_13010 [Tepidisphaeraceae bacterium]|jgi:hypothetical protein